MHLACITMPLILPSCCLLKVRTESNFRTESNEHETLINKQKLAFSYKKKTTIIGFKYIIKSLHFRVDTTRKCSDSEGVHTAAWDFQMRTTARTCIFVQFLILFELWCHWEMTEDSCSGYVQLVCPPSYWLYLWLWHHDLKASSITSYIWGLYLQWFTESWCRSILRS